MTLYERMKRMMIAGMVLALAGVKHMSGTETERARALREAAERAKRRKEDELQHARKVANGFLRAGQLFTTQPEAEA